MANLWFYFGKDIKFCEFLSHENLSLTSKKFKFVSQTDSTNPFVVQPLTIGKGVGGGTLESVGLAVQRGLKFV